MAVSLAVAVALLAPVVFLIIEASQAGRHEITRLLFRHLTEELLWNTVRLAALVTIGCAVVGTGAAFAIERTDVPASGAPHS
jgi:iron(III) transport system permease protein